MSLQVIFPPALISKGALGNLSCKSFSFDHWYYICTDDWCDSSICASTTLAYPLWSPVASVLIETDIKRGCAQELMVWSALLEMLSKGGRHSEEEEQSLCEDWAPTEQRTWDTWVLLAISVSVCAVQLTQLGPVYSSERIFFSLGWSAGCFTFRSLNKQEMKRTSNKMTNRAPHITPLSWEAQCESLWGVGVPAVVHP